MLHVTSHDYAILHFTRLYSTCCTSLHRTLPRPAIHNNACQTILQTTLLDHTPLYLLYYATQYFKVRYCTKPARLYVALPNFDVLHSTTLHLPALLNHKKLYVTLLHFACYTSLYVTLPNATLPYIAR